MAASNNTPLQLYYSVTANNTPSAGNLVNGELAINTNDGILYYKDSSGAVQSIASKNSNAGIFSANTGQLGFPVGTTAQRSALPQAGFTRYNSTTNQFEGYSSVAGAAISTITFATTTATLTTATAHGLSTGAVVTVSGATPAAYNGTFSITVTTTTAFTYTMLTNPGSNATPVGSYTSGNWTSLGVYASTPNSVLVSGSSPTSALTSIRPGAYGSAILSTTGSSVTAGNFAINSQYTITSLGNTDFASIGAPSGTFTGYINDLAATPAAGTILTVVTGTVAVGQFLVGPGGTGISSGTKITSQLSPTQWRVNNSQLAGSVGTPLTITRITPLFIATGVGSGTGTATLNQWGLAAGPFIQQGTGYGQYSNPVKIGWNNANDLLATVDTTDIGSILGVGGYGSSWQSPTRAAATAYTNSTGRPIQVSIILNSTTSGDFGGELFVNGVLIAKQVNYASNAGYKTTLTAIVPWGTTYQMNFTRNSTIDSWRELST